MTPTATPAAPVKLMRAPLALIAGGFLLASCSGGISGLDPVAPSQPAPPPSQASAPSGQTIGTGNVRIALLLPLSNAGGIGTAAKSMLNAAELAIAEHGGDTVRILVKDDRGTLEGAREAARLALSEGAELVLGPLLAPAVQGASDVARSAGRPVIAFSTDTTVAARGVYLMSFLPESDVDRIVTFAASKGKRSFGALIPESAYGNVASAAFQQSVSRAGAKLGPVERYTPGAKLGEAVKRLAASASQIDVLFIADSGDNLAEIGRALASAGISGARVQFLGNGQWNDPKTFRVSQLAGAWFPAPDAGGFDGFTQRYRGKFGGDPARIATLAYDAVALASALTKQRGSERFSEKTLTDVSGYSGHDGVFRFRNDGINERALGVYEIAGGRSKLISEPRKSFAGGA